MDHCLYFCVQLRQYTRNPGLYDHCNSCKLASFLYCKNVYTLDTRKVKELREVRNSRRGLDLQMFLDWIFPYPWPLVYGTWSTTTSAGIQAPHLRAIWCIQGESYLWLRDWMYKRRGARRSLISSRTRLVPPLNPYQFESGTATFAPMDPLDWKA